MAEYHVHIPEKYAALFDRKETCISCVRTCDEALLKTILTQYAMDIRQVLASHQFLMRFHAVDFFLKYRWSLDDCSSTFLGDDEILPAEWTLVLENSGDPMTVQDLCEMVSNGKMKQWWPRSLCSFIAATHALSLPDLDELCHHHAKVKFDSATPTPSSQNSFTTMPLATKLPSPSHAPLNRPISSKGIKAKKLYEIRRFASTLHALVCHESKDMLVVDVGAGRGLLMTELSQNYNYPVLGIDFDDVKTCTARSLSLARPFDRQSAAFFFANSTRSINSHEVLSDFILQELSVHSKSTHFPSRHLWMLCGLHTCGDLAPNMIRIFVKEESMRWLMNVGCCYSLLTESGGGGILTGGGGILTGGGGVITGGGGNMTGHCSGFPISQHFIDSKFIYLGQASRMLACQASSRWMEDLDVSESFQRHFFRALFQVFLFQHNIITLENSSSIAIGKIASKHLSTFHSYVSASLSRMGINEYIIPGTRLNDHVIPGTRLNEQFTSETTPSAANSSSKLSTAAKSSPATITTTCHFPENHSQKSLKSCYFKTSWSSENLSINTSPHNLNQMYETYVESGRMRISFVWSLRALLSGLFEALILIDRLLYLIEQNQLRRTVYHQPPFQLIAMFPLFRKSRSPRNYAIYAAKQ